MPEEKKERTIFKTFRAEVVKIDDKEEGVIDMLIPMSTDSVDRAGESIDPKGWKKYLKAFMKRAPLVSSHNYHGLQNQIGELLDLQITEKGLLAKPKYYINQGNSEADWGYFLATKGMAAYSVGFIPVKWVDSKDEPKRTYTEQELLEISHVIVPCNRDAIQEMRSKSIDPVTNKTIDDILEAGFIEIEEAEEKISDEEIDRIAEGVAKEILEKELILKPEETDDSIRLPVKGEEGKHKGHKIRWITISAKEGIRGIYCIDCKKIITYVFDKGKGWTMEKAKKWMADHGKTIEDYFQKVDWDTEYKVEDIDYEALEKDIFTEEGEGTGVLNVLNIEGKIGYSLNDIYDIVKENKELKEKIKDIELKAGAVLNAKNKKDLKDAQALIQQVLDSATTGEEDSLEIDDEKDIEDDNTVIDLTTDTVDDPPINEPEDEDKIEVDEKVIADCITKQMNYTLGKLDKSDT